MNLIELDQTRSKAGSYDRKEEGGIQKAEEIVLAFIQSSDFATREIYKSH